MLSAADYSGINKKLYLNKRLEESQRLRHSCPVYLGLWSVPFSCSAIQLVTTLPHGPTMAATSHLSAVASQAGRKGGGFRFRRLPFSFFSLKNYPALGEGEEGKRQIRCLSLTRLKDVALLPLNLVECGLLLFVSGHTQCFTTKLLVLASRSGPPPWKTQETHGHAHDRIFL